jgi:hypothetical protein
MAITSLLPTGEIINRVAVEIGQVPVTDPYSSDDPIFMKLRYLLQIAGEELVMAYPWEFLTASHEIVTADGDTGVYPLPPDFSYMIPQTGWERSAETPLGDSLTPQEWTYLNAKNLASSTLTTAFRLADGTFNLHPSNPVEGLRLTFEYISKSWVRSPTQPYEYRDTILSGGDVPLFDKTLISRYLKLKYLQASGFDTTAAEDDFAQNFSFITGKDKGGQVLNAGRTRMSVPYLTPANVPDTGYGR